MVKGYKFALLAGLLWVTSSQKCWAPAPTAVEYDALEQARLVTLVALLETGLFQWPDNVFGVSLEITEFLKRLLAGDLTRLAAALAPASSPVCGDSRTQAQILKAFEAVARNPVDAIAQIGTAGAPGPVAKMFLLAVEGTIGDPRVQPATGPNPSCFGLTVTTGGGATVPGLAALAARQPGVERVTATDWDTLVANALYAQALLENPGLKPERRQSLINRLYSGSKRSSSAPAVIGNNAGPAAAAAARAALTAIVPPRSPSPARAAELVVPSAAGSRHTSDARAGSPGSQPFFGGTVAGRAPRGVAAFPPPRCATLAGRSPQPGGENVGGAGLPRVASPQPPSSQASSGHVLTNPRVAAPTRDRSPSQRSGGEAGWHDAGGAASAAHAGTYPGSCLVGSLIPLERRSEPAPGFGPVSEAALQIAERLAPPPANVPENPQTAAAARAAEIAAAKDATRAAESAFSAAREAAQAIGPSRDFIIRRAAQVAGRAHLAACAAAVRAGAAPVALSPEARMALGIHDSNQTQVHVVTHPDFVSVYYGSHNRQAAAQAADDVARAAAAVRAITAEAQRIPPDDAPAAAGAPDPVVALHAVRGDAAPDAGGFRRSSPQRSARGFAARASSPYPGRGDDLVVADVEDEQPSAPFTSASFAGGAARGALALRSAAASSRWASPARSPGALAAGAASPGLPGNADLVLAEVDDGEGVVSSRLGGGRFPAAGAAARALLRPAVGNGSRRSSPARSARGSAAGADLPPAQGGGRRLKQALQQGRGFAGGDGAAVLRSLGLAVSPPDVAAAAPRSRTPIAAGSLLTAPTGRPFCCANLQGTCRWRPTLTKPCKFGSHAAPSNINLPLQCSFNPRCRCHHELPGDERAAAIAADAAGVLAGGL